MNFACRKIQQRKIAEEEMSPTQSNNSVGPNTKPPVERDSRLAEKIARKLKLQLVDRRLRDTNWLESAKI